MTQIALNAHCKPKRPFSFKSLMDVLSLLRQRRSLSKLDDAALQDIGITRAQARTEAARPIWDAPDFWQK